MADAPPNSARKSLYDLSEDKVKFVTQRTVLKQEIKQAEDLVPQVRKDEKFIEAQQLRLEKIGREIAARNDLLKQKDQKDTVAIAFQNQYLEKQQALIQESINVTVHGGCREWVQRGRESGREQGWWLGANEGGCTGIGEEAEDAASLLVERGVAGQHPLREAAPVT
jgi:hypothetical protein